MQRILYLLVAAGVLGALSELTDRHRTCPRTLIPSYFSDTESWRQLGAEHPGALVAILNPASGPGAVADPTYLALDQRARRAGVRVLGYVSTSYANRPLDQVLSDMDKYRSWYGVDGFFLDEAPADPQLGYYLAARQHALRGRGQLVVVNPGLPPSRSYMQAADIVVTFEGAPAAQRTNHALGWMRAYPPERFAHLVYSVPTVSQMTTAVDQALAAHAGNVFVTSENLPNPWSRLPRYLTAERRMLSVRCL